MTAKSGDRAELARSIGRWLTKPDLDISRILHIAPAQAGNSSETWLIAAEDGNGRRREWVLRIQPRLRQIYEDPSITRQFAVIRALSANTDLPIPKAITLEEDTSIVGAPFFVMERAEGEAPPNGYHHEGLLAAATAAAREKMWNTGVTMLARLHATAPAPFGFLGWPAGPADDGVAQELARWESYLSWAAVPHLPVYSRALRWLEDHRAEPAGIGFAWGDARPCNLLYDGERISAMLDWETASLGTAETDLGWWLFYDRMITDAVGLPRLDGIPDAEATVRLWEDTIGRRARDVHWHTVFAGYRFAMISEKAIRMAISEGQMAGGMEGEGNPAIRLLGQLIAD